MDWIRARLTYANVMVTLLTFLVLGSGAAAAFRLPRNSVFSRHIVNNQVKGRDVDESTLKGLLRGRGRSLAGRATLILGGGGQQPILDVPGFGVIQGGCGSGGAGVGFKNQSGGDLRIYPFADGADQTPVTVGDGADSTLFPSGVGSAGFTLMQIVNPDIADQRLLTVIATRDAQSGSQCPVQARALTNFL
jgi:hypothetical protein